MICVLDTNTIINMCVLEVGGQRVYDILKKCAFRVVVPSYLMDNELSPALKKRKEQLSSVYDEVETVEFYVKKFKPSEKFDGDASCIKNIEKWYKEKGYEDDYKTNIHEGEKRCLEASLFFSRKRQDMVVYITDDLCSQTNIPEFFNEQMIGYVWGTLDFILYVYTRQRMNITKSHVQSSIQDFFNYCQEPDANRQKGYSDKLDVCCNSLGNVYSTCNQECLQT